MATTTAPRSPQRTKLLGDPVPLLTGLVRKYRVLATVAARRHKSAETPQQLVERVTSLCNAARRAPSLPEMIFGLWRIEGLVLAQFTGCDDPTLSLAALQLPVESGPPAHCGLAMAAVLREGFSVPRLQQRLGAADPAFSGFCWETVGLMLAVFERDLFGRMAGLLGQLGLLYHRPLAPYQADSFIAAFPAQVQRYLAHGYGRCLYFKVAGLSRAVRSALQGGSVLPEPCVRGVAAAYTLINSRDLDRLLELRGRGNQPHLESGLEGGMLNTLVLLAWTRPGCLNHLAPTSERARRLIQEAENRAETAHADGQGPPLIA